MYIIYTYVCILNLCIYVLCIYLHLHTNVFLALLYVYKLKEPIPSSNHRRFLRQFAQLSQQNAIYLEPK